VVQRLVQVPAFAIIVETRLTDNKAIKNVQGEFQDLNAPTFFLFKAAVFLRGKNNKS
jgi:hypothetical protein